MIVVRRVAGVIAGLAIAIAFVMSSELVTHKLYPPPEGMDMMDLEQAKPYIAGLPATAFAIVLVGHLIGTLAGTTAAAGIAKNRAPGYILGAVLLAGGIYNATAIPQPVWFSATSFAIYVVATMIGVRLAVPSRTTALA